MSKFYFSFLENYNLFRSLPQTLELWAMLFLTISISSVLSTLSILEGLFLFNNTYTQIYIEQEFLIKTEIETDIKDSQCYICGSFIWVTSFLTWNKKSPLKIHTALYRNILKKFKDLWDSPWFKNKYFNIWICNFHQGSNYENRNSLPFRPVWCLLTI